MADDSPIDFDMSEFHYRAASAAPQRLRPERDRVQQDAANAAWLVDQGLFEGDPLAAAERMSDARCPTCHRRHRTDGGRMALHASGSRQCSGVGRDPAEGRKARAA